MSISTPFIRRPVAVDEASTICRSHDISFKAPELADTSSPKTPWSTPSPRSSPATELEQLGETRAR
jgi:hypothetical protein